MLLKYMQKRDWLTAALCALLILLQVFLDLRIPEYMTVITEAITNHEPVSVIERYGLEMILCAVLSILVSLGASLMAAITSVSFCRSLRENIFNNVSRFSPEDVGKFSVDSLITRSSNDVSQVQNFYAQALQILVKAPIMTVWALAKMVGAEWEWTAVTASCVLIMVCITAFIIRITKRKYRLIPKITDKINHSALEHLTGIRVVRAYNAEAFQEEKFEEASLEMMDTSIYIWRRSSLIFPLSSATSNFVTLAIYWLGITMIASSGNIDHNVVLFSDMIVFSSYAIQILMAFSDLARFIQFSNRAAASSERVTEVIEYTPTILDGEFDGNTDVEGAVEFEHVSFTYPGYSAEALHDISFRVEKGKTLAGIGATGSGKTTLVNLILRMYDATSGTVRVDDVNVRDYKQAALRSKLGLVPQNYHIFTGTVEQNVNYGSTESERTIEDVRTAIAIAQAKEFVDDLPDQEQFAITEGGSNLSGGQKQRLSVARALCKNAEICVLDDPFSALDFATDKRLREALNSQNKSSTKILVTQRVGTVMDADDIIVLDEGRMIGHGKHDELMENCPLYRELAISQMAEGTI